MFPGTGKNRIEPDSEIVNPPINFAAWEKDRLKNRGLL